MDGRFEEEGLRSQSRKSTQSRQRQYFEQKKRQQQRPELQNQNDAAGGQASHDQEPRSLDVLNLNNLAAPNSHHNESANADSAIPQVGFSLSNVSPTEALRKITLGNSNLKEAGSQPRSVHQHCMVRVYLHSCLFCDLSVLYLGRMSSPFGHQDVPAAVNSHEEPLGCKMPPSINSSSRQKHQNLELQSEISLIDLVSYEGPKNKSTTRPAPEAHVSFSVKGLGHIKMETPPHSPGSIKRVLPLPPKAMRLMHKAKQSVPIGVTTALDSMNSISMLKEKRSSDKMGGISDESCYERRKQFNCYFPDSFENHNSDLCCEDEDMFCEPHAEKDWQSKRSKIDGNLPDKNSDRLWKIDQFNSGDHFPTPRKELFDTIDYGFKDRYSPERRNSTRSSTRFQNTGIPSPHDLFSDHSLMDDDEDTDLFEWERHPPSKRKCDSNITFDPSAWSFDMVDDSEKRRSPLSEESCTSAAAMKDRKCKKTSPLAKREENVTNQKDEFHVSLDKLDFPNMDAHLHGMSRFNDPEKLDHRRTTDQKNLETADWPEKVVEKRRTREPSCRVSLNEKFANWDSPTSHLMGGTGLTNSSSCTAAHEDKPHFSSVPDMSAYQTVRSTERRPTSKVSSVFHRPENAIFEEGIHMQHPVSDIFGEKNEFSNPFHAKDFQSDVDLSTFFGKKVDKNKEDNFGTFSDRDAEAFLAKKAVSSVSQTVGQHGMCSQPSGKDSFRHGFSPGINFLESEPKTFWEDTHVSNATFQRDLELNDLMARKIGDNKEGKNEMSEKPDNKMLTKTCKPSSNCRNEMSRTETCSDGSEVSNNPEVQKETTSKEEVQKETSAAATQNPANLSCLQESSAELLQVHTHVRPVTSEILYNPGVDSKAPSHLRDKIHNVGDHSANGFMFQSPFIGEVGIEKKKIIASVSPNNSDVQYQFMLEQRVLRRLCVQKIVVGTPMKDKLDKDKRFVMVEDGSHVLAKSV
ncbi:hypothetical protein ACP70R_031090 [Stipagrostis hirtigluma subsp. patula]